MGAPSRHRRHVPCPVCAASVPTDQARWCGNCGAPLGPIVTTAGRAETTARRRRRALASSGVGASVIALAGLAGALASDGDPRSGAGLASDVSLARASFGAELDADARRGPTDVEQDETSGDDLPDELVAVHRPPTTPTSAAAGSR